MVMQDCNPALGKLWQKFMASLSYKENWEERMNISQGAGDIAQCLSTLP